MLSKNRKRCHDLKNSLWSKGLNKWNIKYSLFYIHFFLDLWHIRIHHECEGGIEKSDLSRKPSKFKYFSSLCEPWIGITRLAWQLKTGFTVSVKARAKFLYIGTKLYLGACIEKATEQSLS